MLADCGARQKMRSEDQLGFGTGWVMKYAVLPIFHTREFGLEKWKLDDGNPMTGPVRR